MFIKHFVSVEVKAATEIKTWCIESCLENKYDKINSGVVVLNLTVSKHLTGSRSGLIPLTTVVKRLIQFVGNLHDCINSKKLVKKVGSLTTRSQKARILISTLCFLTPCCKDH